MNEDIIREIVSKTVKSFLKSNAAAAGSIPVKESNAIPVAVSARHVHLTKEAVETLFGKGHKLTFKRNITLPGEFLAEERVSIVTAKGELRNVAVLGPERSQVQVEVSQTDARHLGINAPLRLSGDVEGSANVYIISNNASITANSSTIVARNHIHMTPLDAERFKVRDGDKVCVQVNSKRPVLFDDVIIRVSDKFALIFHIDADEGNACMLQDNDTCVIVNKADCCIGASGGNNAAVGASGAVGSANAKKTLHNSSEKFISEHKAKELAKGNVKTVTFKKGVILSPLAKDVFSNARIKVEFV
ncbi:MAG: phosphate propanoyltransferase [Spirochaetes bacterium]|nr:phosphate propanoyltransferase [Spirochaetota bacterium]